MQGRCWTDGCVLVMYRVDMRFDTAHTGAGSREDISVVLNPPKQAQRIGATFHQHRQWVVTSRRRQSAPSLGRYLAVGGCRSLLRVGHGNGLSAWSLLFHAAVAEPGTRSLAAPTVCQLMYSVGWCSLSADVVSQLVQSVPAAARLPARMREPETRG